MAKTKKIQSKFDVMLDIETLDNVASSVILQIAAVAFDRYSGIRKDLPEFKATVSIANQVDMYKRTMSESTILWWFRQKPEAIENVILAEGKVDLPTALYQFSQWYEAITSNGSIEAWIWCKGAKFDFSILSDAYKACSLPVPWFYRREMDLRSLQNFFPEESQIKFKGIAHDALDDCKNQIQQVVNVFKAKPKLA